MLKAYISSLVNNYLKLFGFEIVKLERASYIHNMQTQLDRYGHFKSYSKKKSIDTNGNPIPWFTYPAIEYIDQLDLSDVDVLEWGSGSSSEYFQKNAKSIITIEHDKNWYESNKSSFVGNNKIIFTNLNSYIDTAYSLNKKFDLIIVDGVQRDACMMAARRLINDGGLIILDNSDRYPKLCEIMRQRDFLQIDMHGIGPINDYGWTTSIFYSKNSNPVPKNRQPTVPIGGGY